MYKNLVEYIFNLLVMFRFSGWFQAKADKETFCQEYSDFPLSPKTHGALALPAFCLAVFGRHTFSILPQPRSYSLGPMLWWLNSSMVHLPGAQMFCLAVVARCCYAP
jgi:hypothetical protein